jgi:hypothetical protein
MEKTLKRLIWLYVILLIVEGALRKWIVPSLSDPLLVVRDPVAIAIYAFAFMSGRFPINGFILFIAGLAVASAAASLIAGQTNLLVLAYGLRINYGHLPLIWIMAETLTRKDVERMGCFLLLAAVPMTLVMIQQFRSSPSAWINRGIGNDEMGQIYGALGRIRPPGLFSFITGPQAFYPLVAAFFFSQVSGLRRLWWPVLLGGGLAVLVADLAGRLAIQVESLGGAGESDQVAGAAGVAAQEGRQGRLGELAGGPGLDVGLDAQLDRLRRPGEQGRK